MRLARDFFDRQLATGNFHLTTVKGVVLVTVLVLFLSGDSNDVERNEPPRMADGRRRRVAGRRRDGPGLARPQGATKKVLFFIKSAGFPHSVVTRPKGKPSMAEKILTDAGKEHGFEVVATKDGGMFEPDKIGEWDAFVFETTGNLLSEGTMEKSPAMSPDGEKAFYDAIRGGKGFLGMHCAADTFGHFAPRNKGAEDPYVQMIGGEFISHGAQQEVEIDIADPDFPGVEDGFGRRQCLPHQGRVVLAQEHARRPARHHGPEHQGDEGLGLPASQLPRSPGRGSTARAGSSTPRWAIARTSGRARCTRGS